MGMSEQVSSTSTTITQPDHRADWINLCTDGCANWVQTGEYQGFIGASGWNIYSPSSEHMYIENQTPCYYINADLGAPPSPDYPYFIAYDGHHLIDSCGRMEYEYIFRVGSWSGTIAGYGYMPSYAGQPQVMEELEWQSGSAPPSGTDRFGCDPSFNAVSGYGIHVSNNQGTTWSLWTAAVDATAINTSDPSMTYSNKATWWAFWAS